MFKNGLFKVISIFLFLFVWESQASLISRMKKCGRMFLSVKQKAGKLRESTPSSLLKPSTDILEELNEEGTEVHSLITVYRTGLKSYSTLTRQSLEEWVNFVDQNAFFDRMKKYVEQIGDSHYWAGYVPKKKNLGEKHLPEGQFVIRLSMRVKSGWAKRELPAFFEHNIHWESRARDQQLDRETIQLIFRELYKLHGETPEEAVMKFQEKHISIVNTDKPLAEFVYPFLFDDEKIKQVKEVVRKVVGDRGSHVVSETTGE